MKEAEKKGLKSQNGKTRIDLIIPEAIIALGHVMRIGAEKYKPNSWQNVEDGEEYHYAALMRHALAWHAGEVTDKESQQSHMAHVMANAMFCFYHELKGKKNKND